MKTTIAIFVSLIGLQAMSQTTPLIKWGFDINPGQRQHLAVNKRGIEAVYMQAECIGSGFAPLSVELNGRPYTNFTIPCHDPNYRIPIGANVNVAELAFINNSTSNRIRIHALQAVGSAQAAARVSFGSGSGYSDSSAAQLAEDSIAAVNALKPGANYNQLGAYLHPIRKSAARLRAVAAAHSTYGATVSAALLDLKSKIEAACAYLDQNLETDNSFDTTTDLMTVKERISAMMR